MSIEPKPAKRRSRDQWRALIQEQQESSLNQAEFCHSRGLCLGTFYNWKKKLGVTAPAQSQPVDWLELPVQKNALCSSSPWDIELQLPGNIILRMRQ